MSSFTVAMLIINSTHICTFSLHGFAGEEKDISIGFHPHDDIVLNNIKIWYTKMYSSSFHVLYVHI